MPTPISRKRARYESEDAVKQELDSETTRSVSAAASTRADSSQRNPRGGGGLGHELERDGTPELEQDSEFWLPDGTVILEFRCYRALLADNSPVFKAMFAGQHPSRLVPIDEHHSIPCPVIQLTDSPEDLRYILRAPKVRAGRASRERPSVPQGHYTDDLDAWVKTSLWEPPDWEDNVCIGVVSPARLINEPLLLPTALMACVYLEQDVVRGFEREDGTREMLTLDDLGRCIKANRTIRETHVIAILRVFEDTVAATCPREKGCKAALRLALRRAQERLGWVLKSSPFWSFNQLVHNIPKDLATCDECTVMVEQRYRQECEAFWARLPELLDIEVPGWPAVVVEEDA